MFLIFRWLITWPHIQLLPSLLSPHAMLNLGPLRDNMMMINSTTETIRKRKQSLALHTPVNGPGSLLDVVWWAALCIGCSLFCCCFSQIIRAARHSHYFRIIVGAKQFTVASGVLAPWSMRFFFCYENTSSDVQCLTPERYDIFFTSRSLFFGVLHGADAYRTKHFWQAERAVYASFQSIRPINTPSPSGKCMFAK